MRVLITGALGFIGSHLAEAYLARGDDVYGIDDFSGNVVDRVEGMTLLPLDARYTNMISPEVDLVVHAASPVGAVALLERPSIVAEIIETTQGVLSYCEYHGCPLVNISSSEVYGFSGVYHESDDCVVPHRLSHRIQYAAGKLAAEHLVRTSSVDAISIRPFNVAGPRQTSSKGFVIPTFVEQALAGEPLTVFDGGAQERSFTAVWDVVDFVAGTAPDLFGRAEVINIGNPDNRTTILDLAHRVLDQTADGDVVFTDGKRVHGPAYEEAKGIVKVPDISLARSFGWAPKVDLDSMIRRTAVDVRGGMVVLNGQ